MATRFYLPSTGTAGASPAVDAAWDASVSAFIRRATVTTKISSAFATISLDGNTDSGDTDYCYVQWVSAPIAAQTIAAQAVDWVVSLFEENARANQVLACCIRVVSGDGATVRGTITPLQRDGTELGTSQSSRYDIDSTSTEVVASAGDRIVIEIGTGGNPDTGAGGDSHDADVRIGDNSATDFGESGSETSDYCGWVEFANTITFELPAITGTLTVTAAAATLSADGTVTGGETTATASLDVTAASATLEAAVVSIIDGDLDSTLAAATLASAGVTPIDGDFDTTLSAATLTSAVTTTATGSLDITTADATLSASGSGATEASAILAVTTADATMTGAGNVTVTGALSRTAASATLSAAGVSSIDGDLSVTTANATLSAAGVSLVDGDLIVTTANATLTGAATLTATGAVNTTLDAATLAGEGDVLVYGALAVTTANATLISTGISTLETTGQLWHCVLADATLLAAGEGSFPAPVLPRRDRSPVSVGGRQAVVYRRRRAEDEEY